MSLHLLLLALALQPGVAAPIRHQVTEGWVCPTRPSATARSELQASGCVLTRVEDIDPQGRELWFLATLVADTAADLSREPLGVSIGAVAASEVMWNGARIGGNGTPAASRADERPGDMDATVYLPSTHVRRGHNDLLVHMSGFHNRLRLTMPVHYIVVARYGILLQRTPYYLPAIMMAGALLVAIAWFGGMWARRPRDLQALLVVLMAVCALGQLAAEVWRGLWPLPYHWQAWRLVAIQCLATGFILVLVAYVTGRFAPRWRTRAVWATGLVALLTAAVPGYDRWTFLTLTLPVVMTLVLVAPAVRRGDQGARGIAATFVLFLLLAAIDTWGFLDRGFYLGTAALTLVLLHDQWRVGVDAQEGELAARRRAEELEVALLRRRFAPHWLLNTLNSLTDWIESEPKTAVRLIEALGEEYHLVADMSGKSLVTLAEEVTLCRKHLEVMSLRVDRAFHLDCINVDLEQKVPPGVVQTLVENAFSHGRYADGGTFVLRRLTPSGGTQLELVTPPPEDAMFADTVSHHGEGLAYVRAQLQHAFGPSAQVVDGPAEAGGWRTQLVLGVTS